MDGLDVRVRVSEDDVTYTVVQGIRSVSSDDGREAIDVSAWPDDPDHMTPGPEDSSAGIDGLYYPGDTLGQKLFRDTILDKSALFIEVLRDGAAGYKQEIVVNSYSVNVGRDGVAEVSIGVDGILGRIDVVGQAPLVPVFTEAQDGLDARLLRSGTSTAMTDETCTDSGDGFTFQIDDVTKRVWDRLATFVIEADPGGGFVVIPAADYTLNRLFGAITFDNSQATFPVRVSSGNFLPMTVVAEAMEYSWEITRSIVPKSRFTDDHNRKAYGPLAFSGSANMFFDAAADFQNDVQTPGQVFVLELQQELAVDLRAWIMLTNDQEAGERTGTYDESISFDGSIDAERRMVSFSTTDGP